MKIRLEFSTPTWFTQRLRLLYKLAPSWGKHLYLQAISIVICFFILSTLITLFYSMWLTSSIIVILLSGFTSSFLSTYLLYSPKTLYKMYWKKEDNPILEFKIERD